MKKVVVAGANGFIGRHLVPALVKEYEVVALTRSPESFESVRNVLWDGKTQGAWTIELEGAYAVINLSGKSVNCRHNEENKQRILDSRVDTTHAIGSAIDACEVPPTVWLNSSGVSIYKESFDTPQDESVQDFDNDFLAEVTEKWEGACLEHAIHTRKVVMRTSVVLGIEDGSYPLIARLTKLFAGGKQGSGKQYFPWIHVNDFCKVVQDLLLKEASIEGPVNMCAPDLITNAQFMAAMRRAHNRPFGIPTPAFLLKIASAIIGTEASLVLKSSYVLPRVVNESNLKLDYPTIDEALKDLSAKS